MHRHVNGGVLQEYGTESRVSEDVVGDLCVVNGDIKEMPSTERIEHYVYDRSHLGVDRVEHFLYK